MSDMIKSLDLYSISFQRLNNYFVKCQKGPIKFEMELMRMENLDFVYIVRILRNGTSDISKLTTRIVNAMNL